MRKTTIIVSVLLSLLFASSSSAVLLSGPITAQPESVGLFVWGDGVNDLEQQWSVSSPYSSGWFYGSSYTISNADVYTYPGLTDPTSITNAETFSYKGDYTFAEEGDTVFFKGANTYGAWVIEDIYPSADGSFPYAYLNGTWYFQTDGSGNFSIIPEPSSIMLVFTGLAGLISVKRFRQ